MALRLAGHRAVADSPRVRALELERKIRVAAWIYLALLAVAFVFALLPRHAELPNGAVRPSGEPAAVTSTTS